MSNNILIGKYYPIKSRIHKMNSLSKIICTLLFIIISFISFDYKLNILIILLLMLMLLDSRVPLKAYFKTILSIKWLLLFIVLINIILKNPWNILIFSTLRVVYIVLYTSLLTLTTPPNEITDGLEKLFKPLKLIKIPINKMALSISLALRFIPTIVDQGNKILKSQASRGIDYKHSKLKIKLMALKSLIIPIFVLTIKKADDLADAMEVRLYNINSKRTNFRQNKWSIYDTFLIIIHIALLVLVVKEVIL